MARRRRRREEHENLERWLVSYADFITLLFAFFVVMYAVSSVNEGKYRVLSDALAAIFQATPRATAPIQVGEPLRGKAPVPEDVRSGVELPVPPPAARAGLDLGRAGAEVARMAEEMRRTLAPLIDQDLVTVRKGDFWLEVEIRNKVLFPSGSARLAPQAEAVLERVAAILRPHPNPIHVEGHTDDVPIRNDLFPSNWELSAARAASVVHLFARAGVAPERMAAIGYGEYRPVAANDTEEGRARNRRVVIVVLASGEGRHLPDIELRHGEAAP
ncbi:flagellar motor protein MotD [Inmirania thermothiophila]|uniref:Chemotaxis protein MotB n=1 Tax=Inmirania thermothiophila TaxID=1750597 RepID=A0A3N1Y7Z8_9GAMM|nr:flagellar motor protein MotD [Inmirania thermothiophila]ROR34949.1 chemotaxis protein MotB [Inmirania thermothiophila]